MRHFEIVETLSMPFPHSWETKSWNRSQADFDANGTYYRVVFAHKEFLPDDRDWYACEFYALSLDGTKRIDVIGNGNSFRVFATVAAIIAEWLRDQQPAVLGFSAEGASRMRLYRSLVERLSKDIPEYRVNVHTGSSKANYYLIKK